MQLFSYFRSSASYRVRIAMNIKGLNYELKPVHLLKMGGQQHTESYKKLNPLGQVPCLVDKTLNLTQSMAIIIYLESIQPTPPLLPSEAEQKALVFEFCEIINSGIQPLQNLSVVNRIKSEFGATEKQISDWTKHYVSAGLTTLETKLQKQAELYCFGDTVTAADVFLVPQVFSAKRIGISVDDYPKIKSIYGRLIQLEPFQKAEPSKQPDAE